MNEQNANEVRLHALDYWQVIRNRYGVILLAFFLVFMTAAVITYIMPREYLSRVRLQVEPFASSYQVFNDNSSQQALTPTFIQTQFQIITSKETLYRVIDELQLVKHWDDAKTRADAYGMLLGKIETEEVRGTDLIDIEVYHTDPHEAAELANAIARMYRERRNSNESSRSLAALDMLNAQENVQRQKVEDARLKMVELMEKFKIVDLGTGYPSYYTQDSPETGRKQLVMSSKMSTLKAEEEISMITTQIEQLQGLGVNELMEQAVALNITDSTITGMFPQYQALKVQAESLKQSGLGSKHPEMQMVGSQLKEMERLLKGGVEAVKRSLETRLLIAQKSLENLEGIEDRQEVESMDERKRYTQYMEAKRNYETQNLILTNMTESLLKEKVDLTMPRDPITIHEVAESNEVPAKPRVPLQLALGAVVGIVFGVGLAFFLEYLDTSVKTLEDVERYLGVPVLAVIPKDVGVTSQAEWPESRRGGLSNSSNEY